MKSRQPRWKVQIALFCCLGWYVRLQRCGRAVPDMQTQHNQVRWRCCDFTSMLASNSGFPSAKFWRILQQLHILISYNSLDFWKHPVLAALGQPLICLGKDLAGIYANPNMSDTGSRSFVCPFDGRKGPSQEENAPIEKLKNFFHISGNKGTMSSRQRWWRAKFKLSSYRMQL